MEEKYLRAKDFFETLYEIYNKKEYIKTDPIRFPHEIVGNKEFIAFTASCFAYGNMKAIQSFLYRYFEYAGNDPLEINPEPDEKLYYRFQTYKDVGAYSALMKKIYENYGSIGNLFEKAGVSSIETAHLGMELLRKHIDNMTAGINFLIPMPGKSASKRLYMFMRWMIRSDDVDFGLWKIFDKSALYMPSDTHILRMATNLGIIGPNEAGKKAVDKVTNFFKQLNPEDPAKYDFSITRLGIVTDCQYSENTKCKTCVHNAGCLFN